MASELECDPGSLLGFDTDCLSRSFWHPMLVQKGVHTIPPSQPQSQQPPPPYSNEEALHRLRDCFENQNFRFSYHHRVENAFRNITGPVLRSVINHPKAAVFQSEWSPKQNRYKYALNGYYRDYQIGVIFSFEQIETSPGVTEMAVIITAYVIGGDKGALPI